MLLEFCCSLLILLFSYASLSKVLEYDKFVFQMSLSHVEVIKASARFLAWSVPLLELGIVVLLLLPRTKALGLYTSLLLLIIFSLYIAGMLLSGTNLPCTCGGIISKLSWKGHLAFNLFFILVNTIAIIHYRKTNNPAKKKDMNINFSRV